MPQSPITDEQVQRRHEGRDDAQTPVTVTTRPDKAGGPPFKVLRDLGQSRSHPYNDLDRGLDIDRHVPVVDPTQRLIRFGGSRHSFDV